jgi:hypothetical protein
MRLRILKKLSKKAAPILVKHYGLKIFLAERGDSYHGMKVTCKCTRKLKGGKNEYGYKISCDCQWHPLAGTPMYGATSGYYEPEWDERTAFEELRERVHYGDRPKSMTDADWQNAMKVSRLTPVDIEQMIQWIKESDLL